ncbi:MAG: mechanosensitive ion channel domain-containing protein [Pirellulales bacterium]
MGRTPLLSAAHVVGGVAGQIAQPGGRSDAPHSPLDEAWHETWQQVIRMLPHLVIALLLVVVGVLIASLLRAVVSRHAKQAGLFQPEAWGRVCYLAVTLSVALAAVRVAGLELDLLENMLLIAFGAVAAGVSLAMGLGGREVVSGLLAGYYLRKRFEAGDRVTVAGLEGTVREVGPVSTIVETEENDLLYRRSVPNTLLLKEGVR